MRDIETAPRRAFELPREPKREEPPAKTAAESLPSIALDDARRGIEAGIQNMDVNLRFMRAPGIVPQTFIGDSHGNALTGYAANFLMAPHGAASASVDRQTLLLSQSMDVHGTAIATYAGCMSGAYIVGANVHEAAGLATNSWLFVDPGYVGPGFNQRFTVNGLPVSVGAATYVSGGSSVKVLERMDDWVKLEQLRHRAKGLMLTGGVSNGVVGGFARLSLARDKELILRRWVRPNVAQAVLVRRGEGMKGYLRDKGVALGVVKPAMSWPDLAWPRKMDLGDQVICTVNGSITGGVALVTGMVVTGLHYTRSGEFELVVHRRKNSETNFIDTMTVVLSPKKVTHGLSASVDFPLLGALHADALKSRVTRQSFTFEIDEPEAMEAYQKILEGELPGTTAELDADEVRDLLHFSQKIAGEKLPKGVKRIFAEKVEVPLSVTFGAGITLPRYIPGLNMPGLSIDRRTERGRHVIGDGETAVATESRSIQIEKQKLNRGTDTRRVYMQAKRVAWSRDGTTYARGIVLGVNLKVDKTRLDNRNAIIKTLNKDIFSDPLTERFTNAKPDDKHAYEVSVERDLGPLELSRLVRLGGQEKFPQKASVALKALLYELADLGPVAVEKPEITAPVWNAYLKRSGIAGVGAVHRLLGDDSRLSIVAMSSAPAYVSKKMLKLTVKYDPKMDPQIHGLEDLTQRIVRASKALRASTAALQDALLDPLLARYQPQKQSEIVADLRDTQKKLSGLLQTAHLSRDNRALLMQRLSTKTRRRLSYP